MEMWMQSVDQAETEQFCDFEKNDMVVSACQAGLSMPESTDVQEFSHTVISRFKLEWAEKSKYAMRNFLCIPKAREEWTCSS